MFVSYLINEKSFLGIMRIITKNTGSDFPYNKIIHFNNQAES